MRPRGNSISMSIQTPEENLSQQEQCYDLKYPQVRRGKYMFVILENRLVANKDIKGTH